MRADDQGKGGVAALGARPKQDREEARARAHAMFCLRATIWNDSGPQLIAIGGSVGQRQVERGAGACAAIRRRFRVRCMCGAMSSASGCSASSGARRLPRAPMPRRSPTSSMRMCRKRALMALEGGQSVDRRCGPRKEGGARRRRRDCRRGPVPRSPGSGSSACRDDAAADCCPHRAMCPMQRRTFSTSNLHTISASRISPSSMPAGRWTRWFASCLERHALQARIGPRAAPRRFISFLTL